MADGAHDAVRPHRLSRRTSPNSDRRDANLGQRITRRRAPKPPKEEAE